MKYICGIFYGVFIESAFKRQRGGGRGQEEDAFSPAPSTLTPSETRKHNNMEGVGGGGPHDIYRSTFPPPFLNILYTALFFTT